MFQPDHNASPFNVVPPVVLAAAATMALIELALSAGGAGLFGGPGAVGWRLAALERFSFSGPLFLWMVEDTSRLSLENVLRLVSYPFVHAGFTHMLFAVVITLALGKFVGEVFRTSALVAVWLVSAAVGAMAYALLVPTSLPLFGGMPPAYGLIGAFTWILWQRARQRRQNPLRAFQMIGFLLVLQLLFAGLDGGIGPHLVAELAAFGAGFGLSFLVSPGGWSGLRRAVRGR